MANWFGKASQGLSSLREQLEEITTEVLSESTAEVEDEHTELLVARKRLKELESQIAAQSASIQSLQYTNGQLEDQARTTEAGREEKEAQIRELNARLNDSSTSSTQHPQSSGGPRTRRDSSLIVDTFASDELVMNSPSFASATGVGGGMLGESGGSYSPPGSPDSFEINSLRDECKQLRAEVNHWKAIVNSKDVRSGDDDGESKEELKAQIESWKAKLMDEVEKHQIELTTLQELHSAQLNSHQKQKRDSFDAEEEGDGWNDEKSGEIDIDEAAAKGVDEEQLRREYQDRIDSLEEKLKTAETENARLIEATTKNEADQAEWSAEQERLETKLGQLEAENKELTSAYNDLNEELEKRQLESGDMVNSNRELSDKLESLKGDLVEYEEKYEKCKADNMTSIQQLSELTDELDRLKTQLDATPQVTDQIEVEMRELERQLTEMSASSEQYAVQLTEARTQIDEQAAKLSANDRSLTTVKTLLHQLIGLSSSTSGGGGGGGGAGEENVDLDDIEQLTAAAISKRRELEEMKIEYERLKLAADAMKDIPNQAEPSDPSSQQDHQAPSFSSSDERNEEWKVLIEEKETEIDRLKERIQELEVSVAAASVDAAASTSADMSTTRTTAEDNDDFDPVLSSSTATQLETGEKANSDGGSSGDSNGWDRLHEDAKKEEGAADGAEGEVAGGKLSSNQLESQLREALAALTEKTEEYEKLNKEFSRLGQDLLEKDELLQQIFTELKGLEMQVSQYKEREVTLKGNIQRLTTDTSNKDEQITRLKSELEEAFEKLEESTQVTSDLEAKVAKMDAADVAASSKTSELTDALTAANSELDVLRQEKSEMTETLSTVQLEVDALRTNQQQSSASKDSEQELDQARTDLEQARSDLTSERKEREMLASLLDAAKLELDSLRSSTNESISSDAAKQDELKQLYEKQLDDVNSKMADSLRTHEEQVNEINSKMATLLESKAESDVKIAAMEAEKAQLTQLLTDKHAEAIAYYQELQKQQAEVTAGRSANEQQLAELARQCGEKDDQIRQLSVQLTGIQETQSANTDAASGQIQQLEMNLKRARAELDAERSHKERLQSDITHNSASEQKLQKELERLRGHLLMIEENHTTELVVAEERETDLRNKVRDLESKLWSDTQNEKDSSSQLTEQLNDLRTELGALGSQRDAALLQLSERDEELERSQRALHSLQSVLQQMQTDQDSLMQTELTRFKNQLKVVMKERDTLQSQLAGSQEELRSREAQWKNSLRLEEELSRREESMVSMEVELQKRDAHLADLQAKAAKEYKKESEKLDKEVMKNLFISYFSAPNNKKTEVAHLIGSVIGVSGEDLDRVLGAGSGGWFSGFLGGGAGQRGGGGPDSQQQSITAQFIRFLEEESRERAEKESRSPPPPPSMLRSGGGSGGMGGASGSGGTSSSRAMTMPTFENPSPQTASLLTDNPSTSEFLKTALIKESKD